MRRKSPRCIIRRWGICRMDARYPLYRAFSRIGWQLHATCFFKENVFPWRECFPEWGKGKKARIYTDLGGDSCLTNNDICFPAPLIDSKTTKDKCPLLVLRLTVQGRSKSVSPLAQRFFLEPCPEARYTRYGYSAPKLLSNSFLGRISLHS
jgi:hypothetical protein